MKESDITSEIIVKAKEIASLWRAEIYVGMGVAIFNASTSMLTEVGIIMELDKKDERIWVGKESKESWYYWNNLEGGWLIPIPSISDCLEKLIELGFKVDIETQALNQKKHWGVKTWGHYSKKARWFYSKGLLEALLSALLEALEKQEVKNEKI